MFRTGAVFGIVAFAILVVLAPVRAEPDAEAERVFDDLFGEPMRQAQVTREDADDVALAEQMVGAADALKDNDALRVLLYTKAFGLATQSDAGFESAMRAIGQAAELAPERRDEFDDKVIAAYNRRFRRASGDQRDQLAEQMIATAMRIGDGRIDRGDYEGALGTYRSALTAANMVRSPRRDDIQKAVRSATDKMVTQRKAAMIARRLKQMPDNEQLLDQLVHLVVVELDDPAAAMQHIDKIKDEQWAARVRLANTPIHALEADDALELADWYEQLGERATGDAQRAMLDRQRVYLQRYLAENDSEDDVHAVRARVKLKQLTELTDADGGDDSGGDADTDLGRVINLLSLVDVKADARQGQWVENKGQVGTVTKTAASIRFPVQLNGSYRLALRVMIDFSSAGYYDEMRVYLPVSEKRHSYFEMPFGGQYWSYNSSPTLGVARQPRMLAAALPVNKPSTFVIEVRRRDGKVGIVVNVNGKQLCKWSGTESECNGGTWSGTDPGRAGVYFSGFTAAIQQAQVIMLDGEAVADR